MSDHHAVADVVESSGSTPVAEVHLSRDLVFLLLGCRRPRFDGLCWEHVAYFVAKDGRLLAYGKTGQPLGPAWKLVKDRTHLPFPG